MQILVWIGIAAGVLVGGYIAFMIIGTAVTRMQGHEPQGVEVDIDVPRVVRVGEGFGLRVRITDTSGRERSLRSVDVDEQLLKGFTIDSVEPAPEEPGSRLGTRIHGFRRAIGGGSSVDVVFRCRASEPGEYAGDVTVYVDSNSFRYMSRGVAVTVRS